MSETTRKKLEIEVHSVDEMLNGDSPLVVQTINEDIVDALWKQARKYKGCGPFEIEIKVPENDLHRGEEVRCRIRDYFCHEVQDAGLEIRDILRTGWQCLGIGLAAATPIILISEFLIYAYEERLPEFISRGLIVLAWVALWHPAEMLLYEHLPVRKRRKLAQALIEAPLTLRPRKSRGIEN
jgi:hypothetical protein